MQSASVKISTSLCSASYVSCKRDTVRICCGAPCCGAGRAAINQYFLPARPTAANLLHALVGWGADTPPHTLPHSATLAPRPDRRAPWHQILAMPLVITTFWGKDAPVANRTSGWTDRQTDGRTPCRYIDPAPHTMLAVSTNDKYSVIHHYLSAQGDRTAAWHKTSNKYIDRYTTQCIWHSLQVSYTQADTVWPAANTSAPLVFSPTKLEHQTPAPIRPRQYLRSTRHSGHSIFTSQH